MICERCKQKPATVHLQQILNGEKTEQHFCQDCAKLSKQFEIPISLEQFFQGFLGSYAEPAKASAATCPECGFSYKTFKSTGRLGCKACYPAFRRELAALLKQVHGSGEHQGKFPKKYGAEMLSRRRLDGLRQQLGRAVTSEEYEEAARLRDEIRRLEGGAPR